MAQKRDRATGLKRLEAVCAGGLGGPTLAQDDGSLLNAIADTLERPRTDEEAARVEAWLLESEPDPAEALWAGMDM